MMTFKQRLKRAITLIVNRLGESSTIQGLSAVATLAGGVAYDDTKMVAWTAIAAFVSAMLKILLPDRLYDPKSTE